MLYREMQNKTKIIKIQRIRFPLKVLELKIYSQTFIKKIKIGKCA